MGQGIWVGTCLSEEALRFAGWLSLLAKHARHFTANNHVPFSIESFIGGTRDRWVDAESLGVWVGTRFSQFRIWGFPELQVLDWREGYPRHFI